MSAKASGYAKALVACPNGEVITAREKLVLMCLADSHQDKAKRFTYPSVETIAVEAMCDRRSCQRYLGSLERKGVICRLRPPNHGAGIGVFYFFPAFDELPKGWQPAALFPTPFLFEKGGERAAEGRQKGGNSSVAPIERAQEREQEQEQKLKATPHTPLEREGGDCSEEAIDARETKTSAACMATPSLPAGKGERPPAARRDAGPLARSTPGSRPATGHGSVEAAVDQVCSALAVANERKRKLFRRVIVLEEEKGEPPPTTALAMIAAWRKQEDMSAFLAAKYGLEKFFGNGIWKRETRWHWNEELLRHRAQASVGSLH